MEPSRLYTSTLQRSHLRTSKPSFQAQISSKADTASEVEVASSSVPLCDRTSSSKTTEYSGDLCPLRKTEPRTSEELPVLQLLQSQDAQVQIDPTLDLVTTWVDEMGPPPGGLSFELNFRRMKGREDMLGKMLIDFENVFISNGSSDQRRHPSDRSNRADNNKNRSSTAPLPNAAQRRRRKGISRSTTSQVSQPESNNSDAPLDHSLGCLPLCPKMLSCPFVKRNRRRYDYVANSCTERFGFPTPGKLVEHLKRVHSLRVPCCITCKQRFSGRTRSHAEHARQLHASLEHCEPRQLSYTEPEWMTEDEDARFASSVILGQSSTAEEKWRSIYRQVFDVPEDFPVPDPYYDYLIPSHQSNTMDSHTGHESYSLEYYNHHLNRQASVVESLMTEPLLLPDDRLGSGAWSQGDAQRPEVISSRDPIQWAALLAERAPPLPVPTTFLTSQSLDMNEVTQQAGLYEHGVVYQGQDSGYQSLDQVSGLETGMPLDVCERVRSCDSTSEAQVDAALLSEEDAQHDSRIDGPGVGVWYPTS